MAVDSLDHDLILGEFLQSPQQEMKSCFVPFKTIQIKEMKWGFQPEIRCSLVKQFRLEHQHKVPWKTFSQVK